LNDVEENYGKVKPVVKEEIVVKQEPRRLERKVVESIEEVIPKYTKDELFFSDDEMRASYPRGLLGWITTSEEDKREFYKNRGSYWEKVERIRQTPDQVFEHFSASERELYDVFMSVSIDDVPDYARLDKLVPERDWRDMIGGRAVYNPEIDFDNLSKSDLLLMFFQEKHEGFPHDSRLSIVDFEFSGFCVKNLY